MFAAFPKIFALGTKPVANILDNEVEITEKVDGSQFIFGNINNVLYVRSKGAEMSVHSPEKMFTEAVEYVHKLFENGRVPDGYSFYAEYLKKPKHNVLTYDRIPKNHLALFGVCEVASRTFVDKYELIQKYAELLDIDTVPLIYSGKITAEEVLKLLDRKSYLGGADIEGVVIKSYNEILIGGQLLPVTSAKYVSEAFKEVHRKNWNSEHTGAGKWQTFKDGYRTEARWQKAVQHLKENGQLKVEPADIGLLIKEVKKDIVEEEKENIKDFLWKEFGDDLLRKAVAGLPEWYKEQLALGKIE